MNWLEQIQKTNQKRQSSVAIGNPISIRVLADIPLTAKRSNVFRIEVEILKIAERVTKGNDPCYFFACRDGDDVTFSIVVWDAQMADFKGTVDEGMHKTFDVRIPKPPYAAFTLA